MAVPDVHVFATLLLIKFQELVKNTLAESHTLPFYTPHGLSHIQGVEATIGEICLHLPPGTAPSPLEWLLLRFCAWGHDLGMIERVAEEYQDARAAGTSDSDDFERLRRDHDKASAYFIQKSIPALFDETMNELRADPIVGAEKPRDKWLRLLTTDPGFPAGDMVGPTLDFLADAQNHLRWSAHVGTFVHSINLITRYHRRAEAIDTAPVARYVLGQRVRIRLLAAIFRLADALHVDRTRFEQTGYEAIVHSPQFTDESRTHWIKSFIVSSLRISPEEHCVHVQADLPVQEALGGPEFGIDSERLKGMLNFIVNDLEEDVLSVSRILLREGFPPLLGVTREVHEIPAMHYPEDVRSALNHILASSSPNTSQLITITLDVLRWHLQEAEKVGRQENGDAMAQYLATKLANQVVSLEKQLVQRPCHEGLRKVHDLLAFIEKLWQARGNGSDPLHQSISALVSVLGPGQLLRTLLDGARETFLEQRAMVRSGVQSDEMLPLFDERTDVVLYGYSEQVLGLLDLINKRQIKARPAVHVLECRTKTSYSSAGNLVYLDADRYARELVRRTGYGGGITIEPDAAVARILSDAKSAIILLGSNAVYPDGAFVHSMGHLTVASVAKAPNLRDRCEVVVLSDSMKIGGSGERLVDDYKKPRERHPDRWLTHSRNVIQQLKTVGVALHNWQEDKVPPELIDKLVVLDHRKTLNGDYVQLADLRFNQRAAYAGKLRERLLASYLALPSNRLSEAVRRERNARFPANQPGNAESLNVANWKLAEDFVRERLPDDCSKWLDSHWRKPAAWAIDRIISVLTNISSEGAA